MPISDWFDMMTQSVTFEPCSGRNVRGEKTYGTAVTYQCRIAGKVQQVIGPEGRLVFSRQTIYLGTADAVDANGRITLSTGDTGSTEETATHPQILATARYPDGDGAHHSELFL